MEQYRTRLVVGFTLMVVGFAAVLIMLSGLLVSERPPQWTWGLLLLVGLGSLVVVSAFAAAARDRRRRTEALFEAG